MSEEASEIVKADETPEPEDPKKSQEEVTADPAEPKTVKSEDHRSGEANDRVRRL